MKRAIAFILVIFSLLYSSITCFATENNEVVEGTVCTKYHSSNINLITTIVENGKGILTTQNGISFTLEFDEKYNGYVLAVHPITEKEKDAFEWFESCIPNEVLKFAPYDIYLLSPENDRVELPNNTFIQITNPNSNNFIIGLSYSGKNIAINSSYKENTLEFNSSDKVNYYLICQKATDIDGDLPQTGDKTNLHLWMVLLVVSLIMLVLTTRKFRAVRKQQ